MKPATIFVGEPLPTVTSNCACASPATIFVGEPLPPIVEKCACVSSALASAAPAATPAPRLQAVPWLRRTPLDAEHELWFDPFADSNVIVANRAAQALLDAFNTQSPPTVLDVDSTAVVAQMEALGVLRPPAARPPRLQPDHQRLTAWLHVTNACNLRCSYCYIHKSNEAMDEATGLAAVDAIFRSALAQGFHEVELKYAGGEATLNMALVRTLHDHAHALAAAHRIALREVVLSNGLVLSADNVAFLRDNDFTLSISLDGLGESHDVQRPLRNGTGSSAFVKRTIEQLVAAGLEPHLSITVTAQNANTLPETISFALNHGLRFNLNFYRDHSCGDSVAAWRNDEAQLIDGIRAAFALIEARLPDYRLIDGMIDRSAFNAPHSTSCGVGDNYMVIDHHGGVAACQMEIKNTITHISDPDPLRVIQNTDFGFRNLPVSEKEGCRDCQWQWWCAGGCSLLTKRMTGRDDVKSPYCNVYKAIYPDLLRLEGLRLLQLQSAQSA